MNAASGHGTGQAALLALVLCLALPSLSFAQRFSVLKCFGVTTNLTGWNPLGALIEGPDGTLYGTTSAGQGSLAGTVFKMQKNGAGYATLKWFTNSLEGAAPQCSLALSGNVLYGTSLSGGSASCGTIFKLGTDGTGFSVLRTFFGADTNGNTPYAALVVSNGVLYGTACSGGTWGKGAVFKLNTDGSGYGLLAQFNTTNGASPYGRLTLSGNTLYGTTRLGGSYGYGTVFAVNTDGGAFQVLHQFSGPEGRSPKSGLVLAGDTLYGTTYVGGTYSYGTVFSLSTDGMVYTVLYHFSGYDGQGPFADLVLAGDTLYGTTLYGGSSYSGGLASGSGTVFAVSTNGSVFNTLKSFSGDGRAPQAGLLLSGNMLYGATCNGGDADAGLIYTLGTDGTGYTVLKPMSGCRDAGTPYGQLLLLGGTLYGTTYSGGSSNAGTVFKIDTSGSNYAVLRSLAAGDGTAPFAGLVAGGDTLYGTASTGGSSSLGTVFKLNTNGGAFAVLRSMDNTTGGNPRAGLVLAGNMLYGTAPNGPPSSGTVYKLGTNGLNFSVLKAFTGPEGSVPFGPLTLSGATLYGNAWSGGAHGWGTLFQINTNGGGFSVLYNSYQGSVANAPFTLANGFLYGTSSFQNYGVIFKVQTNGSAFTNYCIMPGGSDSLPAPGLLLAGNTFYGVTVSGGTSNMGTVFQVNVDGSCCTVLKQFTGGDGNGPSGGLVLSGNTLYGTTSSGGPLGLGVVYRIDLPPVVCATLSGNTLALSWPGCEGLTGQLQYSTNLSQDAWHDLGSPIAMGTSPVTAFDSTGAGSRRFYRVRMY